MFILGIETTCDETGMALIEIKENKIRILANELATQFKVHQKYGGVVPILAAREHKKNLPVILKKIEKNFDLKKIDFLSFSVGPGLLPALVSGKEFVINLAQKLNKKIIPVDHLSAHFYSVLIKNKKDWQKIKEIDFPALVLIVSGGHTNLYLFKNFLEKRKLGETLDDAAGETLDKCARYLGLPYPGGPIIEKLAEKAKGFFPLPKPILQKGYNFSFAGLKTAFIQLVDEIRNYKKLDEKTIADLCFSLQKTIFEILIYKLNKAKDNFKIKTIVVSGGVAANQTLKKMIKKYFVQEKIYFPERKLATDNGLNIALAGYLLYQNGTPPLEKIEVYPRSI
ncbi:MAG: tRNA N6-adenosine threonylcarbamoyltransferase [Candidatus Parcubacteria bacterium]|nr:MAG: tRNA N6-adenosine threonylcarbamoyltransferase [Candidatus Parcubacteria bacterium]